LTKSRLVSFFSFELNPETIPSHLLKIKKTKRKTKKTKKKKEKLQKESSFEESKNKNKI